MNRNWLIAVCLGFLAVHWVNQWLGTYELMFDETQYWFWAQHPAWGYYSKPPVIGWLIALSTAVFGDGTFGVKMLSPVVLLGTGLVLYATARRLQYSTRISALVVLTYLTLPVVTGNAMFITTDVPLQFSWALAMYGVVSALRTPHPARWWMLAGAAAGLGLLSKYTMVAFAASTLVALVLVPSQRKQLATPWPWLAGLLALAVFTPNILWNAHHQFVTFQHTDNNVFSKDIEIYPGDMLGFIGAQFGVFGPILLVALLLSLRGLKRDSDAALLHCYVWPLAIAGVGVSLIAGAQAHWIAPSYLAGVLIVVPWLAAKAPRWLTASLLLQLAVLVLFYAAPMVTSHLSLKKDPVARLFVWNHLAMQIRPIAEAYPQAAVLTDERKIAAALTYGLRGLPNAQPVLKWNPSGRIRDHYSMLTAQVDLIGRPLLVISRSPKPKGMYQPATPVATLQMDGFTFHVNYIRHFKGY